MGPTSLLTFHDAMQEAGGGSSLGQLGSTHDAGAFAQVHTLTEPN